MWKIHKKLPIIKNLSAADFILNTGTLYCTENRKLEKSYHRTLTGYNLKIINSHITDWALHSIYHICCPSHIPECHFKVVNVNVTLKKKKKKNVTLSYIYTKDPCNIAGALR